MEPEKTQYTTQDLDLLEKRVTSGIVTVEELENLDTYISSILNKHNYIKSKMIEVGINSFDEYKKMGNAVILGTILGVISALKKLITSNF